MPLTFTLKSETRLPIDLTRMFVVCPHETSGRLLAAVEILVGNQYCSLGDVFQIEGAGEDRIQVWEGELDRVSGLGAAMRGGTIIVNGNVGCRVGARMSGGRLEIRGNAGDGVGTAMQGGQLIVAGDVGERAGGAETPGEKGMSGGSLLIGGNAGDLAGLRMRRGNLVIAGDCGARAGYQMLAGSLFVGRRIGSQFGHEMKRGTILALTPPDEEPPLPRFRHSGKFPLVAISMLLTAWEKDLAGLPDCQLGLHSLSHRIANDRVRSWDMFYGDHVWGGRGEILVAG